MARHAADNKRPGRSASAARSRRARPARIPAPQRQVAVEAPAAPAPTKPDEMADNIFRTLDRQFHASLAPLSMGLSPISLAEAWLDWSLHLAVSPGTQARSPPRRWKNGRGSQAI